jgi:hypothetical protein
VRRLAQEGGCIEARPWPSLALVALQEARREIIYPFRLRATSHEDHEDSADI